MKIGVIGYTGLVGSSLIGRGYEPIKIDVTEREEVKDYFKRNKFDFVIYAAGYTDVDKCEKDKSKAFQINDIGVNNVLLSYKKNIIYISTDHVFDGKWNLFGNGYSEKHSPNPLNVYGRTKLGGEFLMSTTMKLKLLKRGFIPMGKVIRTSKLFDKKYVQSKLDNQSVFSDRLMRTFLHVEHFCNGLQYFINNWDDMPELLHISGTMNLTHYMFFLACARHLGLPEPEPRKTLLKDATPRPIRGGLSTKLAESLGVPIYSAYEGIELL